MNFIQRGKIFNHDWYLRVGKRTTVTGINSQVGNGESVLFWEFDGYSLCSVQRALAVIQDAYELPKIYILQASHEYSWHAVCLERMPWLQALAIVCQTPYVDTDYIRLAAYREHFTLRLTDKGHGAPLLHTILESAIPESAFLSDFKQGVRYGAWIRSEANHA